MFIRLLSTIAFITLFTACGGGGGEDDAGRDAGKDGGAERSDPELVSAMCALDYGCFPGAHSSLSACVRLASTEISSMDSISAGCGDSMRALYVCLSELEGCPQLENYVTQTPRGRFPCFFQHEAVGSTCVGAPLTDEDVAGAYCTLAMACGPDDYKDRPSCVSGVLDEISLSDGSIDCARATTNLYACLSRLESCDQLERYEWAEPDDETMPCFDARSAFLGACG